MPAPTDAIVAAARRFGVIRPRDVLSSGVAPIHFTRLVRRGVLVRAGRGLYSLAEGEPSRDRTVVEAALRVPRGVVCLLTALRLHSLGTEMPPEAWVAIPAKARAPSADGPPVRIVRMSGQSFSAGVEERVLEGVRVRLYGPAKTVADCFKFRNKIGLDVAIEALRDYRRRRGSVDELLRYAEICRVGRVIRPYLEALS